MHTRIRSISVKTTLVLGVFLILSATHAFAQGAAAGAPQTPPPDPNALKWTALGSLSLSTQRGPAESTNFNANVEVNAETDKRSYNFAADHGFGKYFGQTSTDQQHVKFTFRRDLSSHTYLMGRGSFERNKIQLIDYQYEELVGYGIWAGNAKARFDVAPVVGLVQQQKNIEQIDGNHFTYGGLQILSLTLNPQWSVAQSFSYMKNADTGDLEDWRMQAQVQLTGKIGGPFSINFTYSAEHDNVLSSAATGEKTTHMTTVGLQIQFPTP